MGVSLKLAAAGLGALAAAVVSAPAGADPYYHSYTDGSWTNVEYNDGTCHYYYSHNSYDGETHTNRYGNCAGVAIGPNGQVVPVITGPLIVRPY